MNQGGSAGLSCMEIIQRAQQPYAGIREPVTMETIGRIADRLPELFAWLGKQGVEPSDAPFFRYWVIDMDRELDVEVGVPVAEAIPGDGDIVAGTLPAGRFVTTTHIGHPDELIDATSRLLDWADEQGVRWDVQETPQGDAWGCRLEIYRTDPAVEPDMSRWETDLVFRLSD